VQHATHSDKLLYIVCIYCINEVQQATRRTILGLANKFTTYDALVITNVQIAFDSQEFKDAQEATQEEYGTNSGTQMR
jgi:hypothetical protein